MSVLVLALVHYKAHYEGTCCITVMGMSILLIYVYLQVCWKLNVFAHLKLNYLIFIII